MLTNIINNLGSNPTSLFPDAVRIGLIAAASTIIVHLLLNVFFGSAKLRRPRWALLTKLIYLGTVFSVGVLAVTSFYSVLSHGAMHGWFLLLHVMAAGMFVGVLMCMAIMWAAACRFGNTQNATSQSTSTSLNSKAGEVDYESLPGERFTGLTKFAFWLILISGIVTAGTMLLSMLPLFGTDEMQDLITAHRYAGLLLVIATMFHAYLAIMARFRRV
jgi:hypothetical protein